MFLRRYALIGLGLFAAGCGGSSEPRTNVPRPAPPITLTGAIQDDVVRVSPAVVGAGQVVLIVSNQSGKPQKVTFETDELGGTRGGTTSSSPIIPAGSTGRLKIVVRQGNYSVHVADDSIRAARVKVGPPRKSGQDDLLLP